jgi:PASTA domain
MVVEEEFRAALHGELGDRLSRLQAPADLLDGLRGREAGRRRQARMRVGLAAAGVVVLVGAGTAVRVGPSHGRAVAPAVEPSPVAGPSLAPAPAPSNAVPTSAVTQTAVPLVTAGPCAGLSVMAYQPTGADDHPGKGPWQIAAGDVTHFSFAGDDLLYFKASGPCVDQLVLEPETPVFQTATGPDVQYPFAPNLSEGDISALVTEHDSVDRTGIVGLALACPATGKVCAGTPLATVTINILAKGPARKTGFPAPPTTGARVAVPYVIGMTRAAAMAALLEAGFTGAGEEGSATSTGPPDIVTGQHPLAGSEILPVGYGVVLDISGPGPAHPTGAVKSAPASAVPSLG